MQSIFISVEGATHKEVVKLIKNGGECLELTIISVKEEDVHRLDPDDEYIFDFTDTKTIEIGVPNTSTRERFGQKFVVYNINLSGQYLCSRRFNEFHSMHNELRRMFCRFDFPTFPKKWAINSPSTIDERRFMFDYYLKNVFKVRVIQQSEIVQKFLKPDENGNVPSQGIPINMTDSYGTGVPSMTNSVTNGQDSRINNPAALPDNAQSEDQNGAQNEAQNGAQNRATSGAQNGHQTQNAVDSKQNSVSTKTVNLRGTPIKVSADPRTIKAFLNNEFPVYIHTSPATCITYQPVLDGETIDDLLCHVRTEANIPSAVKTCFSLFKADSTLTKLERIPDNADLAELFESLNEKQCPLVLGRWSVFDDQLLNSGEAKNLIFNEQILREKFKNSTELEHIKDHDDYDAWEFEPCTCDLRTDGSKISLEMNPAAGVILTLVGTTTKLTISWEHILSHEVHDNDVFKLSYQRPGKPEKTLTFTSKQFKLMEDICSFMN